ncbi:hypothetical protein L6164_004465 [Bauhinia variegata]|uniref:Uncharacterized protein n=1 Tax=Bauhinia variegata TaxID=167791 RepID=A0ACB9Q4G2_BAUVA|nr:hypothetical protein L6164_004465 [Bauhinia variegata]
MKPLNAGEQVGKVRGRICKGPCSQFALAKTHEREVVALSHESRGGENGKAEPLNDTRFGLRQLNETKGIAGLNLD